MNAITIFDVLVVKVMKQNHKCTVLKLKPSYIIQDSFKAWKINY